MPAAIKVPDGVDFDGPLYLKDEQPVLNRALVISDNLPALRAMPDDCVDLVYPPFNSGADYLNPIGLPAAEARGLRRDLSLPVPGANEPCEPSAWPASAPSGALPRVALLCSRLPPPPSVLPA